MLAGRAQNTSKRESQKGGQKKEAEKDVRSTERSRGGLRNSLSVKKDAMEKPCPAVLQGTCRSGRSDTCRVRVGMKAQEAVQKGPSSAKKSGFCGKRIVGEAASTKPQGCSAGPKGANQKEEPKAGRPRRSRGQGDARGGWIHKTWGQTRKKTLTSSRKTRAQLFKSRRKESVQTKE